MRIQEKTVPLTRGIGGSVIGSAELHEDGTATITLNEVIHSVGHTWTDATFKLSDTVYHFDQGKQDYVAVSGDDE